MVSLIFNFSLLQTQAQLYMIPLQIVYAVLCIFLRYVAALFPEQDIFYFPALLALSMWLFSAISSSRFFLGTCKNIKIDLFWCSTVFWFLPLHPRVSGFELNSYFHQDVSCFPLHFIPMICYLWVLLMEHLETVSIKQFLGNFRIATPSYA